MILHYQRGFYMVYTEKKECLNKSDKHDCSTLFNCCSCGGNDCGCPYCWDCNACENCSENDLTH